ncbi:MAG: 1-acyl-sn-glycerol-3-phosphate acyltransferase [Chitinophagaceae bacterium]
MLFSRRVLKSGQRRYELFHYFHPKSTPLLYRILKVYVRFSLFFFCRQLRINKPDLLKTQGPLLLACNHPNSFLDAIILDVLFQEPLWSLARGDAFRSPRIRDLFRRLKIMPVYRTSEGVENLSENYNTFNACIDLFRNNGQVIIFSEGKCINEWHLRPLKKGTARLAIQAWEQEIPLRVLPVAVNYSSYRRFGKNVFLHFGDMIHREDIDLSQPDGIRNQSFNQQLRTELETGVFEIPTGDRQLQEELLVVPQSLPVQILLALPALAGFLFHFPMYCMIKLATRKLQDSDHYDSIVTGLLLFFYPFYLLALVIFSCYWFGTPGVLALFIIPLCGRAAMQLKPQLDK